MIKDTLYAKYISQRSGHEILENEEKLVLVMDFCEGG